MDNKFYIAQDFADDPPPHVDQWVNTIWTPGEGGTGFMLTRKTRFGLDDLATPTILMLVATPDHTCIFFFDGKELPAPVHAHWAVMGNQGGSRIIANCESIEEAFCLFNDFCNYQRDYL